MATPITCSPELSGWKIHTTWEEFSPPHLPHWVEVHAVCWLTPNDRVLPCRIATVMDDFGNSYLFNQAHRPLYGLDVYQDYRAWRQAAPLFKPFTKGDTPLEIKDVC